MNERWLGILLTPMRDPITVADKCRRYGMSRQTFYVYQRHFFADGVAALVPLSRRPLTSPGQTAAQFEAEIVRLRNQLALGCSFYPRAPAPLGRANSACGVDDSSSAAT